MARLHQPRGAAFVVGSAGGADKGAEEAVSGLSLDGLKEGLPAAVDELIKDSQQRAAKIKWVTPDPPELSMQFAEANESLSTNSGIVKMGCVRSNSVASGLRLTAPPLVNVKIGTQETSTRLFEKARAAWCDALFP
eukprot:373202-Pyramimonas_sp.AAC.1